MRLRVELRSRREPDHVHGVDAEGVVVEALGTNVWLVEVCVPDETLEGDAWYETFEVRGHEFELVPDAEIVQRKPARPVIARRSLPPPWVGDVSAGNLPPVPDAERLAG
ncbi:MAG: hypothetical protein AAGF11_17970 [Myxococcota bacterium]